MSKKDLKDEELLLLARMGDTKAEQILLERYFLRRFIYGRRARPDLLTFLTPLDFNGAFFKAYLNAVSTYRFGFSTFHSYLQRILTHELNREVVNSLRMANYGYQQLRLDTLINESLSDDMTFHDIVPDDTPSNDPRIFLNYADSLARLSKLPPEIDQITLDLVHLRMEGFSFEEAAARLGLTIHGARKRLKSFRRFADMTLNHGWKKKKDE